MRFTRLSAALILWAVSALAAAGFEIEEHVVYPGTDAARVLRIGSTADRAVFEPILLGFQGANPAVTIDYTIASTTELMNAVTERAATFDLVISSAMDLQTKLANDGFARTHRSDATARLPAWAVWRDQLFAFTQEPGVLIVSERAFSPETVPRTRDSHPLFVAEQSSRRDVFNPKGLAEQRETDVLFQPAQPAQPVSLVVQSLLLGPVHATQPHRLLVDTKLIISD